MTTRLSPVEVGPTPLLWTGQSYRWVGSGTGSPVGVRPLVLASVSPRRRSLLRRWGVPFRAVDPGEDPPLPAHEGWPAAALASLAKATRAARSCPGALVLAADTVVCYHEHTLGKPATAAQATKMLTLLAGRRHQVYTAFALVACTDALQLGWLEIVRTHVRFRALTAEEIAAYVGTGAPLDKAGGYGIQDSGHALVESVRGSYYNVVGLPRRALLHALLQLGWVPGPS
jgi:septum formation protein